MEKGDNSKILIEGNMKVRRKTYWVDRYGYIAEQKGLVYAKSKNDMKNARYFPLKNKKIMKGKRNNNEEYIAICNPNLGNNGVEVKISFPDHKLLERWGKIMMEEMDGRKNNKSTTSDKLKLKETLSTSSRHKSDKKIEDSPAKSTKEMNGVSEPKIEAPKEVSKPILSQTVDVSKVTSTPVTIPTIKQSVDVAQTKVVETSELVKKDVEEFKNVPLSKSITDLPPLNRPVNHGYISRFRSALSAYDKRQLDEVEDMYKNKTYWHLDKTSDSALYYTSKLDRKVPVSKQRVAVPDEPSQQEVIQKLAIPALVTIVCTANFLGYIMPTFVVFLLVAFACGISVFYLLQEHDKVYKVPDLVNPASLCTPVRPYRAKYVSHLVGLPDDVATALSNPEFRKEWDIMVDTLCESESRFVFYKVDESKHVILEIRNPGSKYERKVLYEISKVKGKPYYLRLEVYTTVTKDMQKKLEPEFISNNMNCLKNYVFVSDSVAEMSISLSNIVDNGESIAGNPTLTITDFIAEIDEIDNAEDGISETDEESKVNMSNVEPYRNGVSEKDSSIKSTHKQDDTNNEVPSLKRPIPDPVPVETTPKEVEPVKVEVKVEEKVETNLSPLKSSPKPATPGSNKDQEDDDDNYETPEEEGHSPPSTQVDPSVPATTTPSEPVEEEKIVELSPEEQFNQDLSKCPENEQKYIKMANEGIQKLTNLAETKGWEKSEEKSGFICYTMDAPGGLKCVKSEGYLDFTPDQIIEYLGRPEAPKQYDEMYDGGGTIQELSMGVKFAYTCQKGQWPVQGRDFCRLMITKKYPDGTVIMSNFSHEHPDYPPSKKFTRGEIIIGGWILKPVKGNPNKTHALSLNQVDPKGSVPKSLVNKAVKKRGFVVMKVSEAMSKHY